jgi:hypothetical protein
VTEGSSDPVSFTGTGNAITLAAAGGTLNFTGGSLTANTATLGSGFDAVTFANGTNTVNATSATLTQHNGPTTSNSDSLTGGLGTDTLALTGGGTFNLNNLAVFTGFENVTTTENTSTTMTLTLRNAATTLAVSLGNGNDTVTGSNQNGSSASVTLGTGTDIVTLSKGSNTVNATASTLLAVVDQLTGQGSDTLVLNGGGTFASLGSLGHFSGFATVTLGNSGSTLIVGNIGNNLTVNGTAGGNNSISLATGGAHDTVKYSSTSDSTQAAPDTITLFNVANDKIDVSQIAGAKNFQSTQLSASGTINADSVAWIQTGMGTTLVYINNTTNNTVAQSAAAMKIILTGSLTLTSSDFIFSLTPAGVAGQPVNLALSAPDSAQDSVVTVTIKDAPADWVLNGGIHNADGSWTVMTNDVSF